MTFTQIRQYVKQLLTNSFTNKTTLDKLSTSDDSKLLFDGAEISGSGESAWEDVSDKPFTSLDTDDFTVDESGVLSVVDGAGDTTINGDVYYAYDEYDEEEKVIGKYIDGRPIYRKYFSSLMISTVNSSWQSLLDISSLNVKSITNIQLYKIDNSITAWQGAVYFQVASGYLQVYSPVTAYNFCSAFIEYTKTTDEEDSFTPSLITDNKVLISSAPYYEDYSEEEKVIGCWTDGRAIYKRVIKFDSNLTVSQTAWTSTSIDVTNWKQIINISGFSIEGNTKMALNSKIENNVLSLYSARNSTTSIGIMIIEYTKSTDAENSFTPDMIKQSVLVDTVADDDVTEVVDYLK